MLGQMMSQPLLISSLLVHADRHHGNREIVTRRPEGEIHRTTWRGIAGRSRRVANALEGLGIKQTQRVASLAWNTDRHMELYYGASGAGMVLHTLNPRLHPDHLVWIADNAGDQALFFDITFLPLVEATAARYATVKHFILMSDRAHMPAATKIPGLICYEDLLAEAWDENADPFTNSPRVTVSHLRKKLGEPRIVHTVTGAGYYVAEAER